MSRAAALFAAALVFAAPSVARGHDPGLSALAVRAGHERIVVVLSMAAADARLAAPDGRLDAFALQAIELIRDGVRVGGTVDGVERDPDAGDRVTLSFEHRRGAPVTIRSAVPARLARGHRQLLTVRDEADRIVAQRMLDARLDTLDGAFESDVGVAAPRQFLAIGVQHIVEGYDHLLFVGALLLGLRRLRSVAATVTAFTVAHSITLSAAVLGTVRMPPALVEPLIAASIVFVGVENLARGEVGSRWKVAFAFGLIHGFGFAGAVQDLAGTRGMAAAAPLAWFNAGVELGQITVVLAAWPLVRLLNDRPRLRLRLAPACSLAIAAAGVYWTVERVLT